VGERSSKNLGGGEGEPAKVHETRGHGPVKGGRGGTGRETKIQDAKDCIVADELVTSEGRDLRGFFVFF